MGSSSLSVSSVVVAFSLAVVGVGLFACGGSDSTAGGTVSGDAGVKVTTGSSGDAGASDGGTASVDADGGAKTDAGSTTDAGGATKPDSGGGGSTSMHPATTPPTKTCSYTPDGDGFFDLMSPMGSYTVRLPSGYDKTKPYPVVIGTHGCGDTADNFDTWGPAAYNDDANARENDKQNYIALSVEDVPNDCWNVSDDGKVLAALDAAAACFYVDQSRVTMAGYSSGAEVAYAVGLGNAQRFNGILIEDGACSDNPNEKALLANAAWKINIAHITHQSDEDYPLASVQADWKVILAAGYPLVTSVVAGTHDGTSDDWYSWLEPHITSWTAP